MTAERHLEVLLSGPAAHVQSALSALRSAGVRPEQFVERPEHGLAREHTDPGEAWIGFRCEGIDPDVQAEHLAKVAGAETFDWRLRIHRHAPPASPRLEPGQHPLSRLARLEAEVAALRAGSHLPPIGGGALESPAYIIGADEHPAYLFRQATGSSLSGTGVINSGDLAVTANSPTAMNVLCAAGQVWIPGTIGATLGFGANAGAQSSVSNTNGGSSTSTGFPTSFTAQGPYYCLQDAQVTLGIASANPTQNRIDLICATVADASYAGSSNQAVLQTITGVAGATPAPPTVPQNSVVLSSVWVPAAATSITSGDLNDLRPKGGGWQTLTPGTNITSGALLQAKGALVFLTGLLAATGTITSGATLATVPSNAIPASGQQVVASLVGGSTVVVSIAPTTGAVSIPSGLTSGNAVALNNLYRLI